MRKVFVYRKKKNDKIDQMMEAVLKCPRNHFKWGINHSKVLWFFNELTKTCYDHSSKWASVSSSCGDIKPVGNLQW